MVCIHEPDFEAAGLRHGFVADDADAGCQAPALWEGDKS